MALERALVDDDVVALAAALPEHAGVFKRGDRAVLANERWWPQASSPVSRTTAVISRWVARPSTRRPTTLGSSE